ncbi:MAG: hypothetical protein H7202_04120 [Pedobacter sp.]|nr:hypothetical protein [Pedobacter sp.]
MKFVSILFSLYLITLALLPCSDVPELKGIEQVSYSFQNNYSNSDHCAVEGCAPFCSCSCCAIGKYVDLQATVKLSSPIIQVTYVIRSNTAIKQQPVDVWQPPKLI